MSRIKTRHGSLKFLVKLRLFNVKLFTPGRKWWWWEKEVCLTCSDLPSSNLTLFFKRPSSRFRLRKSPDPGVKFYFTFIWEVSIITLQMQSEAPIKTWNNFGSTLSWATKIPNELLVFIQFQHPLKCWLKLSLYHYRSILDIYLSETRRRQRPWRIFWYIKKFYIKRNFFLHVSGKTLHSYSSPEYSSSPYSLQTVKILASSLRSHVQAVAGGRITLTCLVDRYFSLF